MKVFHVMIDEKVDWENSIRHFPYIVVAENEEGCREHIKNFIDERGTNMWISRIREIRMEDGLILDARAF